MSSSDSRKTSIVDSLLTMDERNDACRSIAKVEAELLRIETDIAKLLGRQKEVADNLPQLRKVLAIHRILPGEIICHIFSILCVGKISIPHEWDMTPPQITVSHVCSKWREIALAIPALWNDVEIARPGSDRWVQVATKLLFDRAGRRGVSLALDMNEIGLRETGNTFYDIVFPLHVKKLHLTLSLSALESLSRISDDIIANIDEIALSINTHNSGQVSITPQFLGKIRSLTCHESSFLQHQNLPWAYIRYLKIYNIKLTLSTVSNILHQSPLLEVCKINVELEDEMEPTTMLSLPQLCAFHIYGHDWSRRSVDALLRSFECPNLTDLCLKFQRWTPETYNIIRNHYNLLRLLKLDLAEYPYPISKVLHDAPVLQELAIARKVLFIDERAIHGISSGKLGCCLTSLDFRGKFDVKEVLDMVAARQRCVKQIVEAGHNWRDQITGIKRIFLLNDDWTGYERYEQEIKEEASELKKLGIEVYLHPLDSETDWE